jgi:heme-degrading monooxygenase HmoA
MLQGQSASGNISAEARTVNGVHHTLSVWSDEEAMRAFLTSGAHLKAMRAIRSIATGRTFGYASERLPGTRLTLSGYDVENPFKKLRNL